MTDKVRTMKQRLNDHTAFRNSCINLTASENALSDAVRNYLASELSNRYGDFEGRDLAKRHYQGCKYIVEIEKLTYNLVSEIYGAKFVELRALSGHIAGVATIMGLLEPGDTIMELGPSSGGHGTGRKLSKCNMINIDIEPIPFDPVEYNIDLDATIRKMRETDVKMIILGSSLFPFPHPVSDIKTEAERLGIPHLIYDASHVFGLIAGGMFQSPLTEGADVMLGSTHKTIFGPQGGMILTNDETKINRISDAVFPILVDNHHLSRLPALFQALQELRTFGEDYAATTIANAKRLAAEIHHLGVPVVGSQKGFTQSHTILLQVANFGEARDIAQRLEGAHIITTAVRLPRELGTEGIRIGLQEMTRLGLEESNLPELARFITDCILEKKSPDDIAPQVCEFRKHFQSLHFCWTQSGPC